MSAAIFQRGQHEHPLSGLVCLEAFPYISLVFQSQLPEVGAHGGSFIHHFSTFHSCNTSTIDLSHSLLVLHMITVLSRSISLTSLGWTRLFNTSVTSSSHIPSQTLLRTLARMGSVARFTSRNTRTENLAHKVVP